MRTSKPKPIDRLLPGVGRLTIRTRRMSRATRDELDRCITRALQEGNLEPIKLLKARAVSPLEFLEAARSKNLLRLRPSPLLEPLVKRWLSESDLRQSSRERYQQSWDFVFKHLSPVATLADLTNDWWQSFTRSRIVSSATLNRDRAAVVAFLNWGKELGLPASDFRPKKLKEEPQRSEILTQEQIRAVLEQCRPDRLPFFWTLIETGARQGEILNLRARDISSTDNLVTIRSQPGSKGRGRTRHIPVSGDLARCLRVLGTIVGNAALFPSSRYTIRDWWQELCERLGIEGVTVHGIRATFITHALDSGVPPVEVQKIVGHSDITMTMRYYRNTAQSQVAAQQARAALGLHSVTA